MPIIIAVSPNEATRAGKIARVVELRDIQIVDATFHVWHDTLNKINQINKGTPAPIQLDLKQQKSATLQNQEIRAVITMRVTGSVKSGKETIRVIESKCVFETKYFLPPDIKVDSKELNAFAGTNALLNVWPYWREYVNSMTSRSPLPTLTVPLLLIRPAKMISGKPGTNGVKSSAQSRPVRKK